MGRIPGDCILDLEYPIDALLRYERIGLNDCSTRADVRARLDQIRQIRGIGPKRMQIIQDWLDEKPDATR
jgi:hypothetical protein